MRISMIRRTQHMTLIEVLIAMALTMVIFMALTYFYQDIDGLNRSQEKAQLASFQLSYVENRLSHILPKAVSSSDKKKDFAFFTSSDANGLLKSGSPSLVFTFDEGIVLNSHFANHVLGRLFLDQNGNFTLATWPSIKRWEPQKAPPMKKEILMENVESIAFEFYVPPTKGQQKDVEKVIIDPKNDWHKEWKAEYKKLPAIVKVLIQKVGDEKPYPFIFPLDNTDMIIIYDR